MPNTTTGNGKIVHPSTRNDTDVPALTLDTPFPNGGGGAHTDAPALPLEKLKLKERSLACLTLVIWLNLFAGGIFIDTKPSRCAISPSSVGALENQPAAAAAAPGACSNYYDEQGNLKSRTPIAASWFIAIVFFLPLNLALLCATAGVLGTFGNIANLYHDRGKTYSQDNTNPYISGLLRGFFVYLFVISGLLVLDDAPFSNSSPGQYIRLAGFLSLFSFIVNYQPHIFSMLVDSAQNRISNSRNGAMAVAQSGDDKMAVQGEKVKATEHRDGTKTLHAETPDDN